MMISNIWEVVVGQLQLAFGKNKFDKAIFHSIMDSTLTRDKNEHNKNCSDII